MISCNSHKTVSKVKGFWSIYFFFNDFQVCFWFLFSPLYSLYLISISFRRFLFFFFFLILFLIKRKGETPSLSKIKLLNIDLPVAKKKMKKITRARKGRHFFVWWFRVAVQLCFLLGGGSSDQYHDEKASIRLGENNFSESKSSQPAIKLNQESPKQVVIDNGLVSVTLSTPEGNVVGISYNGIDNLLDVRNERTDRGYFDVVWNEPGGHGKFDRIEGRNFSVIAKDENQVEVSFLRTWTSSMKSSEVPINIDKRYIFRKGDSGFYCYTIFKRHKGMPAAEVDQVRNVFKLHRDRFNYMAITKYRQRSMPSMEDRERGRPLAFPEAVLLTNPINHQFRGEVDDKYQYSIENKHNTVHGWISSDSDPPVGFWMITPSNEFRNAGPFKQDLTSHVGPITLSMFVSTHYAGKEVTMAFEEGETYKKVFGPVFVYLNSASRDNSSQTLWIDAVHQMSREVKSWPYDFPRSKDYIPLKKRGIVEGNLLVQDRYIKGGRFLRAGSAYVGLALPGAAGSWQKESKGYQYWSRSNKNGYFVIKNVVPGHYNLHAFVPGFIGDYRYNATITITPGGVIKLGKLVYCPPRNGPTLWEIGIPDRSAAEFFVPEPYPTLMNKLYSEQRRDKFRQYGLWERYADLYPEKDLVYTIGVDNYRRNWFFAQVTRSLEHNKTYQATTWQIQFELRNQPLKGKYTLQLALASATDSDLQVRLNDPEAPLPHFRTGLIGEDNAIARHGIHGLYRLYSIEVESHKFIKGKNSIFLTQSKAINPFQGVMYDYIRLERPPSPTT